MPLVLHKVDESPPSRATMMIVEIIGLKVETKDVKLLEGDNFKSEFLEKNPLHTVPVLEDGDFILADSHAIITYLVSKYGADKRADLYPSDLRTRATVDQRLFFDTSILFARIRSVFLSVFKENESSISPKLIAEVYEAYGFLETYLQKSPYVACDHLTLADVSCVASLSSLDTLVPLGDKYPRVKEWWDNIRGEDWYQKANEPGVLKFGNVFKGMLQKNASQ